MVVAVRLGIGGDADGGSEGVTVRGEGRDWRDGDRDGKIIRWEDTVANVILGTESNDPLAYDPGLELHHLIMSVLGGSGGQLERDSV